MDELSARRGETLPIGVKDTEVGALTAELIVKKLITDPEPTLIKLSSFVNGVADLSLSDEDTKIDTGIYIYQVTIVNSDGTTDKYPKMNINSCDDDEDGTTFPTLTIGPSLDD
jgi:hypothetical protein